MIPEYLSAWTRNASPHLVSDDHPEAVAVIAEFIGSLFILNYALLSMVILLTAFVDPTRTVTIHVAQYWKGTAMMGIGLVSIPFVVYATVRYARRTGKMLTRHSP
jgi:hypothetical protein